MTRTYKTGNIIVKSGAIAIIEYTSAAGC